jgi:pimeloyl-ACP methyl ester carboxylesterase
MAGVAPLDRALERVGRWALNRKGFKSRYVETAGGCLHVYDKHTPATSPKLIVLHGISSGATPFSRLLTALAPHVSHIVAPEALGHGFSDCPENLTPDKLFNSLSELLHAETTEPAVIYGNSMGGGIALRYAIENPDRVRALMLCSPAGAQMDAQEYRRFLARLTMDEPAQARDFVNRLYHRTPWYAGVVSRFVFRRFNRVSIRNLLAGASPELLLEPAELRALKMPVLLLWGQSERLLPKENLSFFREHFASHVVIDEPVGMGHIPHLERPRDLARRIRKFLTQLD